MPPGPGRLKAKLDSKAVHVEQDVESHWTASTKRAAGPRQGPASRKPKFKQVGRPKTAAPETRSLNGRRSRELRKLQGRAIAP